jgi:hypothetical protein
MFEPKATSASQSEKLAQEMCTLAKGDVVEKVISFDNDDVPKFLKNLRHFEDESAKVNIRLG